MKKNLNEFSDVDSLKFKKLFSNVGMLILIFMLTISQMFAQQGKTIMGKIIDSSSSPIPGVSVSVQGTTIGTISSAEGMYTINVPETAKVLVFSFVGMKTMEVTIGNQTQINVTMAEESIGLDDVVVVGYGVQKKATLSGSIVQVKGDEVLKGKATQSVATALQGTIPGLVITRTSSRPGNEGIDITLRGGISVNEDASNPMIIIDGVEAFEWELSQINPNDVESVSVLKDAAAAIYGTKAGGGVIMITTKRGKAGKVKVSYSGSEHVNIVGKKFPVANGVEWSNMLVDATLQDALANPNGTESWWMYPEDIWRKMAAGEHYEGYISAGQNWRVLDPNGSDQFDAVYGNTWGRNHNVTISGGNDKLTALTSVGYAKDRSLVDFVYDGQTKYNFRTNIDYKISDWIASEINISYDDRETSTPTQGVGNGIQDFYIFPLYNSYGQYYDTFGSNNVLAYLDEGGRTTNKERLTRLGAKLTFDMDKWIKGLSFTTNANFRIRDGKLIKRQSEVTLYDWAGEKSTDDGLPDYSLGSGSVYKVMKSGSDNYVENTLANELYKTFGAFANYKVSLFMDHNIGLLAGVTAEENKYEKFYLKRTNMSSNDLTDISTGDASTATNGGGSNEYSMLSFLARLNYNYKGIFLLEGQFRRDGSSKFSEENRWANFAGISGGIRFSELSFVKDWNIFDNLKLRGSYGETGSQAGIGNYDYYSTIATGTTVFGADGTKYNTAYINGMSSSNRTWERVATTNYGLDFSVLSNRLSGTFEVFKRENKGMLISNVYPNTLGASAPKTNSGDFKATGWEIQFNWNDKIGDDFSYRIGFSLADAKTEVTKFTGTAAIPVVGYNNGLGAGSYIEGKPLNAMYVYKTDGYLQNWDEVGAYYNDITKTTGGIHPSEGASSQLCPGSVKKVDVNGDGHIDTDDLYFYGDSDPHYNFGITLGSTYKGFDFSMFIQGVGEQHLIRQGQLAYPWYATYTNQNATFIGKTWTVENPNAQFPVLSRVGTRNNWNYRWNNDINVVKVSYARVKSIVLGYTIPRVILSKANITNVRLYVSGDNLFEVSNVKDGFDPETKANSSQGNVDVYARTISFGIDLTF